MMSSFIVRVWWLNVWKMHLCRTIIKNALVSCIVNNHIPLWAMLSRSQQWSVLTYLHIHLSSDGHVCVCVCWTYSRCFSAMGISFVLIVDVAIMKRPKPPRAIGQSDTYNETIAFNIQTSSSALHIARVRLGLACFVSLFVWRTACEYNTKTTRHRDREKETRGAWHMSSPWPHPAVQHPSLVYDLGDGKT